MTTPDPSRIADRTQFGLALTQLRDHAGRTVRDIAKAAGIPVATAGDYFSGRTVPPVRTAEVLPRVLRACGVVDPAAVTSWRQALVRVRRSPVQPPFRGAEPFGQAHAELFFGRDRLVDELTEAVRVRQRVGRPLVVIGRPGAGTSSVLGAGLLPALGGRGLMMTLGDSPCRRLADLLRGSARVAADRIDLAIHRRPERLAGLLGDTAPVVVVDQFEELADLDSSIQDVFVTALTSLSRDGIAVVIGMRDGARIHAPRRLLEDPIRVGRMTDVELASSVESPARRARLTLERGFTDAVVSEVAHLLEPLPMLSRRLLATWRRRSGSALTLSAYRQARQVASSWTT